LEDQIDWESIVQYLGMPVVIKPAVGGGSKSVSVVHTTDQLVEAYRRSGSLSMIAQECIQYENYSRCWVIGREKVRISGYDYVKPRAERYRMDHRLSDDVMDLMTHQCLVLARILGYDMDTVEWAIRDDVPYAIDFLNPAPDCDPPSVGPENFEWVVEEVADLAIRYCLSDASPGLPADWRELCAAVPELPSS
ncbi:MAG: hypothetical protein ACRDGS_13075, partial [Chloroflexota bacterium]